MNTKVAPPPPRSLGEIPTFRFPKCEYSKKIDEETTEKVKGRIDVYSSSFHQRFEFISDNTVLEVPINTIAESSSTKVLRNRPKIKINLKNGDDFVFEMIDFEKRDKFRDQVETMLKIQKDIDNLTPQLRRNFTALSENNELCRLYLALIVRESVLTPAEFWEGREEVIVEAREAERIPGIVSIDMQPDIFQVKNQKYIVNATTEAKKKLFLLYPSAKKAFENCVPSKLSERNFWAKFAKSDYFLGEDSDDKDIKRINKFRKTEEEKLRQEINDRSLTGPSQGHPYPNIALPRNRFDQARDRAVGQSHRGRRMVEVLQTKDADIQKIESRNIESYKVVSWDKLGEYRQTEVLKELRQKKSVDPFSNSAIVTNTQSSNSELLPQSELNRRTDPLDINLDEYHRMVEITNHRRILRRQEMQVKGQLYSQNFRTQLEQIDPQKALCGTNIRIDEIKRVSQQLTNLTGLAGHDEAQRAEEDAKRRTEIGDDIYQEISIINELLRHYWRANPVIGRINNTKHIKKKKKKKNPFVADEVSKEEPKKLTKLERVIKKLKDKMSELEEREEESERGNIRISAEKRNLYEHLKTSIKKALKNYKNKMKKRMEDDEEDEEMIKKRRERLLQDEDEDEVEEEEGNVVDDDDVGMMNNQQIKRGGIDLSVQYTPDDQLRQEQDQQQHQDFYLNQSKFGVSGFSPLTPPAVDHHHQTTQVFPGYESEVTERRNNDLNVNINDGGRVDDTPGLFGNFGLSPMDETPQQFDEDEDDDVEEEVDQNNVGGDESRKRSRSDDLMNFDDGMNRPNKKRKLD